MSLDQMIRDRLSDEISESPAVLMPWLENEVNEVTLIAMHLADESLFKPTAPAGIFEHINPAFLALLDQIEGIRDRAASAYISVNEGRVGLEIRTEMADAAVDAEIDARWEKELARRVA